MYDIGRNVKAVQAGENGVDDFRSLFHHNAFRPLDFSHPTDKAHLFHQFVRKPPGDIDAYRKESRKDCVENVENRSATATTSAISQKIRKTAQRSESVGFESVHARIA